MRQQQENKPVPVDGRKALTTRDEDGLMLDQRRFLTALAENPDPKQAAKTASINVRRPQRWLREDQAFCEAYDELFRGATDVARRRLQLASEQAAETIADQLQAVRGVTLTVDCPDCGSKFKVEAEMPDNTARIRSSETVLKATSVLKDIRKVEGEIGVTYLSAGQRIALEKLRRGLPVGVQQRRDLEEMGLLDGLKTYDGSELIEAEAERQVWADSSPTTSSEEQYRAESNPSAVSEAADAVLPVPSLAAHETPRGADMRPRRRPISVENRYWLR